VSTASRLGRARDWPLRRRFTASVVLAAVLLVVATALTTASLVRVASAQSRVTDTFFDAARTSSDLLTAYLDQETGVRGYLLTDDPRFREPYTRGLGEEQSAVDRLTRRLVHEPALLTELDRVRAAAVRWRSGYAGQTLADVSRGRSADVTKPEQDRGKQLFDDLRRDYGRFDQAVLAARRTATDDLDRGRTVVALAFGGLAGFVVVALVGLGFALRRWILDPLDAVRADVRQVAEGHLEHEITAAGPPDLRQVSGDVEGMRRRLLRSYTEQLAATRTVEQQREQLQQQTDDLRRSNAELEQFAYVASHDLQEPLRKVASFTELLQRRYAGQLDERADSYIAFAVDGAHRMQRLINDLLAFSRVGRVGVTRGDVPLGEALQRALENLQSGIDESDAEIELTGEPLPTVTGDAGLLTQVFQNLIGNAVKFRRPGVAPQVRISCRSDGPAWRLDVQDNGIGIDPEYADRVFVIFSRLNRREDYPGTGIGLALCKKIVEYHGGRIWVEATEGPGTTIGMTLPQATPPQVEDGTEEVAE
jgi:signal transduction histidine kinase